MALLRCDNVALVRTAAGALLFMLLRHKYPVESFLRVILVASAAFLSTQAAIIHWVCAPY